MKKEFATYSEAFNMQVVKGIREGKFASILKAQKTYGICGTAMIQKWIKKYGMEELLPKRVRVETMTEIDELKEAKKRIRDLEKALSDSHMDYCLERAFLEIACEQMGTSREDGKSCNKSVYVALGVNFEGKKEVLGLRIAENEGAKFWMGVLTQLKNRGVEDILTACMDGLTGFPDALRAIYPQTRIQLCIVHMVRNSTKFVSYKDLKMLCADLKQIYSAPTEESGLVAPEDFGKK